MKLNKFAGILSEDVLVIIMLHIKVSLYL